MLTITHITTLLTIGVLFSGGLTLATEAIARRIRRKGAGEETARESWARKWIPVIAGLPLSTFGFPATYSLVVSPVLPLDPWWKAVGWVAAGLFAGLCAVGGSRVAYQIGGTIIRNATS